MRLKAFDPIRHKPYVDREFLYEQVEWVGSKQGFNFWATNCYYCIPDTGIDSSKLQNDHNAILTYVLNPSPRSIVDAFHWSDSPEGHSFLDREWRVKCDTLKEKNPLVRFLSERDIYEKFVNWSRHSNDWREYYDNYHHKQKEMRQMYVRITDEGDVYSTLSWYADNNLTYQNPFEGEYYKVREVSIHGETGALAQGPVVICESDDGNEVFVIGIDGVEFVAETTYQARNTVELTFDGHLTKITPHGFSVGCTSFKKTPELERELRQFFRKLEEKWGIDF